MAGSYHTLDRLAKEIAGETLPSHEEQLRSIEAKFAAYTERTDSKIRDVRARLDWAMAQLDIANAANKELVRRLRAKRRQDRG